MTTYHFTGAFPRVLTGLSQGVNALLTPAHGDTPPYGSTIEARTGDVIETDAQYPHPELEEIAPAGQDAPVEATDATPEPAPSPEAPADPAHDDMTAEGAPAPAPAN